MAKRGYKLQEFVAHSATVNCISIGKKSCRHFITGGDDNLVNLWDIGNPTSLMSLCGHTSPVESVAFDSAEVLVVAGASTGVIKLWDLEEVKMVRTLSGHRSYCTAVEFHPFGEFFASGSMDTNLKVWDIRKKGCIHTYKGHTRGISTVKFTPDGRWMVTGGLDNVVKVWDLTAGKLLHDFKFHDGHIRSIDFHPLEFLLATGSADKTVKFWDLETFELIGSTRREATGVRAMSFHPDGKTLFCGLDESLKVFSWEPIICHDGVDMGWSMLSDLCIHEGKLLGCSHFQNSVGVWVADISLIEPYGAGSELKNVFQELKSNDDNGSLLPGKLGNELKSSLDRRSASPDYESNDIKTIYVDCSDSRYPRREINSVKLVNGVAVVRGRTRSLVERFEKRDNVISNEDKISTTCFPETDALERVSIMTPENDKTITVNHELGKALNVVPEIDKTAIVRCMDKAPNIYPETDKAPPLVSETDKTPRIVLEPDKARHIVSEPDKAPHIVSEPDKAPPLVPKTDKAPPLVPESERAPPLVPETDKAPPLVSETDKEPTVVAETVKASTIPPKGNKALSTIAETVKKPTKVTETLKSAARLYPPNRRSLVSNAAVKRSPMIPVRQRRSSMTPVTDKTISILPATEKVSPATYETDRTSTLQTVLPQISGGESTSGSDGKVTEDLLQTHDVILSTFRSRLTKLQVIRHFWEQNDIKGACNAMRKLPDHAVQADVLSILMEKMDILTLDLFSCLLPVLIGLLESDTERHAKISLEMLLKLVAVFGPVIRSSVSAPPPVGVDLHAEQRLECYNQCFVQLQKIQGMLPALSRRGGLLAKSAQELNLVLQQQS